jgi:hypothetical protein
LTQSDGEIGESESPMHVRWRKVFERKHLLLIFVQFPPLPHDFRIGDSSGASALG